MVVSQVVLMMKKIKKLLKVLMLLFKMKINLLLT